jgi:MFS superfamily sulfate permease-like transporter
MCAQARQNEGVKLKSDRELFAQGIGNILLPFFGGFGDGGHRPTTSP